MQGEILLVNPKDGEDLATNPRRRRKHRARGAGGRFVKTHRARRTNARRRRRRRNPVAALANPRRRRRRRNPVAAFAANPRRRRRARARRRNPRFAVAGGSLTKQLIQAGLGGIGAVALDVALGYAGNVPFVPEAFKSGPLKSVSRVVGALGVGWLVGKVRPAWRTPVTAGALAVTAYFVVRDLVAQFAPQIPLQGYMEGDIQLGYVDPAPALQGSPNVGAYMEPPTVGAYMEQPSMGDWSGDGM